MFVKKKLMIFLFAKVSTVTDARSLTPQDDISECGTGVSGSLTPRKPYCRYEKSVTRGSGSLTLQYDFISFHFRFPHLGVAYSCHSHRTLLHTFVVLFLPFLILTFISYYLAPLQPPFSRLLRQAGDTVAVF